MAFISTVLVTVLVFFCDVCARGRPFPWHEYMDRKTMTVLALIGLVYLVLRKKK